MTDITNEYLMRGFHGGFLALCLFIAIITLGYQASGRIWRAAQPNRGRMIFGWALGVSLFTHTVMFIAISYFGQITIIWWLLVAVLGSLSARLPSGKRQRGRVRRSNRITEKRAPPKLVVTDDRAVTPSLAKDMLGL